MPYPHASCIRSGAGRGAFSSGPTIIFQDSFTGTNGTDLTAHTPEIGGGSWTYSSGSMSIQSNQASLFSMFATSLIRHSISISDNYTVSGTYISGGTGVAVAGRIHASNASAWLAEVDTANSVLKLFELTTGSRTLRATSSSHTWANGDIINLNFVGTLITADVNGGSSINFTSSTHQSNTIAGFYIAAGTTYVMDTWKVTA